MINSTLEKRNEVDKKGRQISVHYTIVNNSLKEYYGEKFGMFFFFLKNKRKSGKNFAK